MIHFSPLSSLCNQSKISPSEITKNEAEVTCERCLTVVEFKNKTPEKYEEWVRQATVDIRHPVPDVST